MGWRAGVVAVVHRVMRVTEDTMYGGKNVEGATNTPETSKRSTEER